jgi:hypothetical protein
MMATDDFDAAHDHASRQPLRFFFRKVIDNVNFLAGVQVHPLPDMCKLGAVFLRLLAGLPGSGLSYTHLERPHREVPIAKGCGVSDQSERTAG